MTTRNILIMFALGAALPTGADAQATSTLPPLLVESREVELALSAAPPYISGPAAVYVLRRGGYVQVRPGSNGYTCLVERDHPSSLAPSCYDREASATILPSVLRTAALRESGLSYGEARRQALLLYESGEFKRPSRPAMNYMMSSQQVLYSSPEGQRVGAWHPHVMIHFPELTNKTIGSDPKDFTNPFVAEEGTPTSHIVVIVAKWSDGKSAVPAGTKAEH